MPNKNPQKSTAKRVSSRKYKILLIVFLDILFLGAAFAISSAITFNSGWQSWWLDQAIMGYLPDYFPLGGPPILQQVWIAAVFVVLTVGMMAAFDSYNSMWRYAGRVEFFKLIISFFASAGAIFLFSILMGIFLDIRIPSVLILLYLLFSVIFASIIRYQSGIRHYLVHLKNRASATAGIKGKTPILRTVVIGAGFSGSQFIDKALTNHMDEGFLPVVLLDENPEKHGTKIHGIRVEGNIAKLAATIRKYRAEAIVIAIVNISRSDLKNIYTECMRFGLPVKVMTALKDANEGTEFATIELRNLKIEELLGRDEFNVNMNLLETSVKNKVVLVTGGAGSIGSELCRQALEFGCKKLIIFDMHENGMFILNEEFRQKYDTSNYTLVVGSVRDEMRLNEVFSKYKPDVVFHAAAYKHVPMMEFSSTEAIKNNVFGTLNTIRAAEDCGAKRFIFISTDKAVNPANIMGASKRIAEMLVQDLGKKSKMQMAAVRFGNVLGSNGSVIPIFINQIKSGGPVTITSKEIKRYFMTIPEAVRLVMQAGALARNGDIFVLDMGEPVLIYDLACDLIKLNGLTPEVDIEIKEVGLRPGEKMFEELCYSKESVDTTAHEGIFVTKMGRIDKNKFKVQLDALKRAVDRQNDAVCEDKIFDIVPTIYRKKDNTDEINNSKKETDTKQKKLTITFEEMEKAV